MAHGQERTGGEGPVKRRAAILPPVLLVLIGLAAFANSVTGPFLLDDLKLRNPPSFETRPFFQLTVLLNRALHGVEPLGYHLMNMGIHVLAGLLLYGCVRRSLELVGERSARAQRWTAFSVAALWVVHPLQTQAVSYITQRAESLAGMFYLGVLYGFIRYAAEKRALWSWFVVVCFAFGMATKEIVATAPVIVLLYDRAFLSASFASALRGRWRFYAGLFAVWVVLFFVFVGGQLFAADSTAGFQTEAVSPLEYARAQPGVLLHYLRLCVWPHPLCLDYVWPKTEGPGDWLWQTLVVGTAALAAAVGALRGNRIGFLGAWFFLILAPTSSFVPVQDLAFEHRMYLSLAAVMALIVVGGRRLAARLGVGAAGQAAAVGLVGLALIGVTLRRNQDYRSALRMWESVVAVAPRNPRAHGSLAVALAEAGRPEEALRSFERSLAIRSDYADTYYEMAVVLHSLGRTEEALEALDTAARLEPKASVFALSGMLLVDAGRMAAAVPMLERAIELEPEVARAHCDLGAALHALGRSAEAAAAFQRALAIDPRYRVAALRLGNVYLDQQKLTEAISTFERALRIDPEMQEAHTNLALALSLSGRHPEALRHFRRALEIPPNTAREHVNLARAHAVLGELDQAQAVLEAALRQTTAGAGGQAAARELRAMLAEIQRARQGG